MRSSAVLWALLAGALVVVAVVMLLIGQWSAAIVALAAALICAVVSWRDRRPRDRGTARRSTR
jgi:CHASE2 domain-containing sensor protein